MGAFCCFSRKSKPKEKVPALISAQNSNPAPRSEPIPAMKSSQSPSVHLKPQPPPRILLNFDSTHVHISTCFTDADIVELKQTPRGTIRKSVHFYCPICMSYFNTILISKCCGNYLCHRCAKDMLSTEASFEVRCPQCNTDPLVLTDVDPQKSVKVYSDSFVKPRISKNSGDPLNTIPEIDTARRDSLDDVVVKDSPLGMDDSFEDNRV